MTPPLARILDGEALTQIFGGWPSFHDAEVLEIRLDRHGISGPQLEAKIYVFEMTPEVTSDGSYRLRHETAATLLFGGVDTLQLEDFNQQNVLWDLSLIDISDRQLEVLKWEVSFQSSFGVSAQFLCETIAVLAAEPFTPTARASSPPGTMSKPRPGEYRPTR
jgi:Immunity protein 50